MTGYIVVVAVVSALAGYIFGCHVTENDMNDKAVAYCKRCREKHSNAPADRMS